MYKSGKMYPNSLCQALRQVKLYRHHPYVYVPQKIVLEKFLTPQPYRNQFANFFHHYKQNEIFQSSNIAILQQQKIANRLRFPVHVFETWCTSDCETA